MTSAHSVAIIPTSHLDLFWLGDYRNCLRRGDEVIRSYLDRAIETGDETFVIDTAIFAEHFLRENPQYEPHVRRLIAEGRLEIGGAYIDRWENLVLGESIIRNIQIGRAWARRHLGIETRLAAHPDLPGLNAQTGQIYAKAGVHYYVTSRKIFQEGRIWRHRGPDGSTMTMLTWPRHYVFLPLDETGLDGRGDGAFINSSHKLSYDDLQERYPHGVVAVSGSAGDLTAAADFTDRYGKDMREYVGQYRAAPALEIGYAIPATVLQPYLESETELAEVQGSLPSVWGVAPDEEMRFFHRVRALEALLLDAETAAAIGFAAGRPALPESASGWRGLYAEDAFFADDDTPPEGREWEWLWRMHVFTQDHNGGGQDGQLSIFQKKVRHDRARGYAREVLDHAVARGATGLPTVVRTRLGRSAEELVLDADTVAALGDGLDGAVQRLADGSALLTIEPARGVGAGPLVPGTPGSANVSQFGAGIRIATSSVIVTVDRGTGTLDVEDLGRGVTWTIPLGGATAVPELGNDVTLATDESAGVSAVVESVELVDDGPLAAHVRVRWSLLEVTWTTVVRVWLGSGRVDVTTTVDWPGFERWQIRLPLVRAARDAVTHGTPFHASGWTERPDGQNTLMPDEISTDDLDSYREVQHWVHVAGERGAGLAILTAHPAFRHAGDGLELVLLRTAPSCGDPRMAWTNPGRTTWELTLAPVDADWRVADVPELADIAWRAPRVVPEGAQEAVELLSNDGDDVRLSALFVEDGRIVARVVNQSGSDRTARLRGLAVGETATIVDLAGIESETIASESGSLRIPVPAWSIQTIDLGRPRRAED